MSIHSDSESDGGSVVHNSTPKTLPGYAWRIYRENLAPSLRQHFQQNRALENLEFVPNGPMSMLAHIVHHTLKDPKLVTLDGYLKWWFGCIAPITVGITITNCKLSPNEEANFERFLVGERELSAQEEAHPVDYYGTLSTSNPHLSLPVEVRISVNSTNLGNSAKTSLVESIQLEGGTRLTAWSIPAIVVLAANEVIKQHPDDEDTHYLASTFAAALKLWHLTTPNDQRQAQWIRTVANLRSSETYGSLLVPDFNKRLSQNFTRRNSAKWDLDAVRNLHMVKLGWISEACRLVKAYTPPPPRPRGSHKRKRSSTHSLSKSCFIPGARWEAEQD